MFISFLRCDWYCWVCWVYKLFEPLFIIYVSLLIKSSVIQRLVLFLSDLMHLFLTFIICDQTLVLPFLFIGNLLLTRLKLVSTRLIFTLHLALQNFRFELNLFVFLIPVIFQNRKATYSFQNPHPHCSEGFSQ